MTIIDYCRYKRALTQSIYIIGFDLKKNQFNVCGTTGNNYLVDFNQQHTCTCMDHVLHQNICKHQMFIIRKIGGLSFEELQKITLLEHISAILKTQMEKRLGEGNGDDCSICLSTMGDEQCIKCTHCNNLYHMECIHSWLKCANKCPLCRGEMDIF